MTFSTDPLSVDAVMSIGMASDADGAIVTPAVRDLDETKLALTQWFSDRLSNAEDLQLEGLTYPRGSGQSHETILFDARWREGGSERHHGYVVRIKPTQFTLFHDDMFTEEYQLMRALHQAGTVPIAPVHWFEDDPSVLGAPFFVMSKVQGSVAISIPSYLDSGWVAEATEAERATLWESAVRALAAVQTLTVDQAPFLDLGTAPTGFDQEWDRWERFLDPIDTADRPLPGYRELLRHLGRTKPANRPPGIVWGDARLGNMMVGDDFRVVALMDWEQPSLGGALHDLGWWLISQRGKIASSGGAALPGMLDREETIALWESVTDISTEGIDWYEAFAGFKMAVTMVRMLDLRGQSAPGGDYDGLFHVRAARELSGL